MKKYKVRQSDFNKINEKYNETACEKLSNNGLNSDIQECLIRPKQDDMYCKCAD